MADKPVTSLTAATTPLAGTEQLHVVEGANSRKTTTQDIANLAPAASIPVEDEDVAVVTATTLNFVGAGVTATDAGSGQANITIPGGGTPTFKGALVYNAASLPSADYTSGVNLTWDSEEYDTDSFHENVTNPSRLTIPSGVSWVEFFGQIRADNTTADTFVRLLLVKNGVVVSGPSRAVTLNVGLTSTGNHIPFISAPIAATVNDYFELRLVIETDTTVVVDAASFFAVKVVG